MAGNQKLSFQFVEFSSLITIHSYQFDQNEMICDSKHITTYQNYIKDPD